MLGKHTILLVQQQPVVSLFVASSYYRGISRHFENFKIAALSAAIGTSNNNQRGLSVVSSNLRIFGAPTEDDDLLQKMMDLNPAAL